MAALFLTVAVFLAVVGVQIVTDANDSVNRWVRWLDNARIFSDRVPSRREVRSFGYECLVLACGFLVGFVVAMV